MEYKFFDNDYVEYFPHPDMVGKGVIRGVCTTDQPVIGATYIIEDISGNVPNKTYPFKFFSVAEIHLKRIQL